MNESELHAARFYALSQISLRAVLSALAKQPGIDVAKLTQDISDELLRHEVSSELKPEGLPRANRTDYAMLRFSLRQVLPDMPVQFDEPPQ